MAFKQIKILRQEEGKGYIFPDASIVIGEVNFSPVSFSEEFEDSLSISFSPSITRFEETNFSLEKNDNIVVAFNPSIVAFEETNFEENLSDDISVNFTPSIAKVEKTIFVKVETDNLTLNFTPTIVKAERTILSDDLSDSVTLSFSPSVTKAEETIISDNPEDSLSLSFVPSIAVFDPTIFSESLSDTLTASFSNIIAKEEVTPTNFSPDITDTPTISFVPSISKFDCPSAGQLLSTYCSGTTLYGTYTNGSCGTYNQIIATNSTSCGYTPPPPPPDPFVVRAKSNVSGAGAQIVTPNEQFQGILSTSYQVIDDDINGNNSYSISVNAELEFTDNGVTYTFDRWVLNGVNYFEESRTFSNLNSDSNLELIYEEETSGSGGGGGGGAPPLTQLP